MKIEANPAHGLIDTPTDLQLAGFAPGQQVAVRARVNEGEWQWDSHAVFLAERDGRVEVARQAPQAGTYAGADAMGLFWSMELNSDTKARSLRGEALPPLWNVDETINTALRAEVDGRQVASCEVVRGVMAPGLIRTPVREDGLVATRFHHSGAPRPGVIFLGGSDGGLNEQWPALLASHDFDVLALAYFGLDGLPPDLCEIPLEYFERAINLMVQRTGADRIGVIGASRGAELALLLGATFPQIRAVVGYVPSGVMWGSVGRDPAAAARASWSHRGKPLPFVPLRGEQPPASTDDGLVFTPTFAASLEDREAVAAASIAVERINGPVLLVSGKDDQLWPSATLAEIAMRRLSEHHFAHEFRHLSYDHAGHYFRFPYLPTTVKSVFHPVVRLPIALGGTPAGDAAAAADSWPKVVEFLRNSLA